MWRYVLWVVCISLAGCASDKPRKSFLPRADFILEDNAAFFAKPADSDQVPAKPTK